MLITTPLLQTIQFKTKLKQQIQIQIMPVGEVILKPLPSKYTITTGVMVIGIIIGKEIIGDLTIFMVQVWDLVGTIGMDQVGI